MFCILHLSDIHRSSREPVDNNSLLAALVADCERYAVESPPVPSPQAIVVSGDLIQGVPLRNRAFARSLENQYTVAGELLSELCKRFLDGDRTRMVLTPGKHDVCWNTSYRAMERVPYADYPDNLYDELTVPDTPYRWSWTDRTLFRIADLEVYQQRMSYYWDFVESFYRDANLQEKIDRNRGFQLFELCDRRIIVAAFDSIYGNDCFALSGAICPDGVGRCSLALRDIARSYDLKIAVWHHCIQGPPIRSDYMDASHVARDDRAWISDGSTWAPTRRGDLDQSCPP